MNKGDMATIRTLVEAGADLTIKSKEGYTALEEVRSQEAKEYLAQAVSPSCPGRMFFMGCGSRAVLFMRWGSRDYAWSVFVPYLYRVRAGARAADQGFGVQGLRA